MSCRSSCCLPRVQLRDLENAAVDDRGSAVGVGGIRELDRCRWFVASPTETLATVVLLPLSLKIPERRPSLRKRRPERLLRRIGAVRAEIDVAGKCRGVRRAAAQGEDVVAALPVCTVMAFRRWKAADEKQDRGVCWCRGVAEADGSARAADGTDGRAGVGDADDERARLHDRADGVRVLEFARVTLLPNVPATVRVPEPERARSSCTSRCD